MLQERSLGPPVLHHRASDQHRDGSHVGVTHRADTCIGLQCQTAGNSPDSRLHTAQSIRVSQGRSLSTWLDHQGVAAGNAEGQRCSLPLELVVGFQKERKPQYFLCWRRAHVIQLWCLTGGCGQNN